MRHIGPLVGTRTWGGLVGTTGVPPTIDGGGITAPGLAFYDLQGQWAVENEGIAPDVEVEYTAADVIAGHDPQLERAVQEGLKLLKQNRVQLMRRDRPRSIARRRKRRRTSRNLDGGSMSSWRRPARALGLLGISSVLASTALGQRGGRTPVPDRHPAPLLTASQLQQIDAYVAKAMDAWGIPGVAVAIVQGDSVMMAKGYGVKELGKPGRVDGHTLFAIGSNTKTTTASLIAMLVDEGKMRWDDPVWKYLPNFRVADAYVSREATIRDLLSHRTDLANDNAVWYGSTLTRSQVVEKLRYLKPEFGFRSRYSYNNLMVAVAGEAAAAAAGTTWENLIQQRLFSPLGMTSSLTSSRMLAPGSNVAAPHMMFRGKQISIAHRDASNVGPAGSVYSSAADLAQYLRMHLGNGVYKGRRLISEQAEAQMRTLVSPTGSGPIFRTDTTDSFWGTVSAGISTISAAIQSLDIPARSTECSRICACCLTSRSASSCSRTISLIRCIRRSFITSSMSCSGAGAGMGRAFAERRHGSNRDDRRRGCASGEPVGLVAARQVRWHVHRFARWRRQSVVGEREVDAQLLSRAHRDLGAVAVQLFSDRLAAAKPVQ